MWTKSVILIVILAVLVSVYDRLLGVERSPIVETQSGKIRGIISQSREGKPYFQFLGIPYAQPPTGQLRFEDPLPVSKWNHVLEADHFRPECLQLEVLILGKVIGSEDCLHINVFTPKIEVEMDSELLPVMIFVHGGLFMGGSSIMYKGKYIVDENVILVTMNYRVAALGFLSSGDGVVRGNQGLKDQALALKWIKQNIQGFGGDPNKITLFGESAGGASTHYQMLSPFSRGQGLFQKVMSMSGTATRMYVSTSDQSGQFKHFGQKFGCTSKKSDEILACLKEVDGSLLVEYHRDASDAIPNNKYALFVPTIESLNDSKTFLSADPKKSLEEGSFERVPWVAGVVAYEGLLYVGRVVRCPKSTMKINEDWQEVFPKLLKYDANKKEITRKIKDFYFGNVDKLDVVNTIHKFADLVSDRLFIHPTYEAARLQSKFSPVYLYYLTYPSQASVFNLVTSITSDGWIPAPIEFLFSQLKRWTQKKLLGMNIPTYGPSHGDELSLLFDLHFLVDVTKQHTDYEFSRIMVKLWTAFAKDENSMELNGARWLAINHKDSVFGHLELNTNGTFMLHPENEDFIRRLRFWTSLNLPFE